MTIGRRSGTPSRFDASFYRTHDTLGYIPSDVQSLRSQATYSSGMPSFGFGMGMGMGKRTTSYASSIISQEPSSSGGGGLAFSQSDRLSQYDELDYKSQDDAGEFDDVKSQYAGTQSGVTVF